MPYNRCQRTTADGPCNGNLYAEVIEGVTEVTCLQCGARREVGHKPTTERPLPGGGNEVKRWRREK